MIYSLSGKTVFYDAGGVAVECGGVAYYCQTSLGTISSIGGVGQSITLYTFMKISENAVDLFGFFTGEELACFKMLIGISGVGPKAALSILSQMSPERLALCVASEDYKYLTVAQGVGAKLAQRIVLELRDKMKTIDLAKGISSAPTQINIGSGNLSEAISALMVLGYGQSEAAGALGSLPPDLPVEELVKAGLRALARGK